VGRVGHQRPVLVVEPFPNVFPRSRAAQKSFSTVLAQLGEKFSHTASIGDFLFHHSLPVDVRHNAKIFREKLVPWAERQLRCRT
jgi:hypothetical protein